MDIKKEARRLYRECFPEDSERCADIIFENSLDVSERREIIFGDELVSVLWLVDKKLYYKGNILPVKHIVGLATSPRFRNKGYAKKLLTETLQTLDVPLVTLYPAVKNFYEKFGFATISGDYSSPDSKSIGVPTDEEAEKIYADFCDKLDFYFLRDEKSFRYYRKVYSADGEDFILTAEGLSSPDGFLPYKYRAPDSPGVMGRIVNVEKSIKMTNLTVPEPITTTDPIIKRNNLSFRAENGKLLPADNGKEIPVSDLISAMFGATPHCSLFGKIKGCLLDKY